MCGYYSRAATNWGAASIRINTVFKGGTVPLCIVIAKFKLDLSQLYASTSSAL